MLIAGFDHGRNKDKLTFVIFDENNKIKYHHQFISFQEFKNWYESKK